MVAELKYTKPLIYLHWIMLVVIVIAFAAMEFRGIFPKGSEERMLMKLVHYSAGFTVLALLGVRIFFRISRQAPAIRPEPSKQTILMAKLMHLMLYIIMLLMPISGWLLLSAEGQPIFAFGLSVPSLIDQNNNLAHTVESVHETMAVIAYVLIGLHALFGLLHHYVKKDNTLQRMLP